MEEIKNVLFEKLIEIFEVGMITGIIPALTIGLIYKVLGI